VANADPHRALSYDRLHSSNSGLGGHHLWDEIKKIIKIYGRQAMKQVDVELVWLL
jgi:hypothetical protein